MRHSWKKQKTYKVLLEKHQGKKTLWGPCCRWEYNIKMDFWVSCFEYL